MQAATDAQIQTPKFRLVHDFMPQFSEPFHLASDPRLLVISEHFTTKLIFQASGNPPLLVLLCGVYLAGVDP